MKARTREPSGVPAATSWRSDAPIDTCTMPCCCASWMHWVPFPAPGGPASTTRAGNTNSPGGFGRHGRPSRSSALAHRASILRAAITHSDSKDIGAHLFGSREEAGAQVGTGVQGPGKTTAPLQKKGSFDQRTTEADVAGPHDLAERSPE